MANRWGVAAEATAPSTGKGDADIGSAASAVNTGVSEMGAAVSTQEGDESRKEGTAELWTFCSSDYG